MVALACLATMSVCLCAAGQWIARVSAAIVAAVATVAGLYTITDTAGCVVRLAIAGVGGALAAALTTCLLSRGIFLIGSAAGGAVAYFVFDSVAPPQVDGPVGEFELWGISGVKWVVMVVSGIAAGCLTVWRRRLVLRIASSLLGGAGVAWTTHASLVEAGKRGWGASAYLGLTIGVALVGIAFQTFVSWSRTPRCGKRRLAPDDTDDDRRTPTSAGPPEGVRVVVGRPMRDGSESDEE